MKQQASNSCFTNNSSTSSNLSPLVSPDEKSQPKVASAADAPLPKAETRKKLASDGIARIPHADARSWPRPGRNRRKKPSLCVRRRDEETVRAAVFQYLDFLRFPEPAAALEETRKD